MDSEKKKQILHERALKYAIDTHFDEKEDIKMNIVEFSLGEELYGIESQFIREVYPLKDVTKLSMAPAFVYGVINVRRKILSIIDLKYFFELPKSEITKKSRVIILEDGDLEFGILADKIENVSKISEESLQKSISTLTGVRQQYLKGVTPEGLIVLDGLKILQDEKIIVQEFV